MNAGPISAVVLAAGLSTRMGHPKPLLPFGQGTVIDHLVMTLLQTSVDEIVVVTGYQREAVERGLALWPVRCVYNADYAAGEMLSSLQAGLRAVPENTSAVVLVLCDQPDLSPDTVARLVEVFRTEGPVAVRPVFAGRPGHPVLVSRRLWPEILALPWSASLRDVLRAHVAEIAEVTVEGDSIHRDMDTPEEYARELALLQRDEQRREDG